MRNKALTIACIIHRNQAEFYTGALWTFDAHRACIFSPIQAKAAVQALNGNKVSSFTCSYVLQNAAFDFYDGEGWANQLLQAKFYEQKGAQAVLQRLSS